MSNGKVLFPSLHPSLRTGQVQAWKRRMGATETPYKGVAVKPKPKLTSKALGVTKKYAKPLITQTRADIERKRAEHTKAIETRKEELYNRLRIRAIVEQVPDYLKKIIPFSFWENIPVEEIAPTIEVLTWGYMGGGPQTSMKGMTPGMYAIEKGKIDPSMVVPFLGVQAGQYMPEEEEEKEVDQLSQAKIVMDMMNTYVNIQAKIKESEGDISAIDMSGFEDFMSGTGFMGGTTPLPGGLEATATAKEIMDDLYRQGLTSPKGHLSEEQVARALAQRLGISGEDALMEVYNYGWGAKIIGLYGTVGEETGITPPGEGR